MPTVKENIVWECTKCKAQYRYEEEAIECERTHEKPKWLDWPESIYIKLGNGDSVKYSIQKENE